MSSIRRLIRLRINHRELGINTRSNMAQAATAIRRIKSQIDMVMSPLMCASFPQPDCRLINPAGQDDLSNAVVS